MVTRTIFGTVALIITILISAHALQAQQTAMKWPGAATPSDTHHEPGIRTGRLSPKQLRLWRSIERVVLAEDEVGHDAIVARNGKDATAKKVN
jgi:hypothetical protein